MPLQKNTVFEAFLRGHAEQSQRQQQEIENQRAAQAREDRQKEHEDALKQIDVQNKRQAAEDKRAAEAQNLVRELGFQSKKDAAVKDYLATGTLPQGSQRISPEPFFDGVEDSEYVLPEGGFGPGANVKFPNRERYRQQEEELQTISYQAELERDIKLAEARARATGATQLAVKEAGDRAAMARLQQNNQDKYDLETFKLNANIDARAEHDRFVTDAKRNLNLDDQHYDWSKIQFVQERLDARNAANIAGKQNRTANSGDKLLTPTQWAAILPYHPDAPTNLTLSEYAKLGPSKTVKYTEEQTKTLQSVDRADIALAELNKALLRHNPDGTTPLDDFFSGGETVSGTLGTFFDRYALTKPENARVAALANQMFTLFKDFGNYGGALTANEERYLKATVLSADRYQSKSEVQAKLENMQRVLEGARYSITARAGGRALRDGEGFEKFGVSINGGQINLNTPLPALNIKSLTDAANQAGGR